MPAPSLDTTCPSLLERIVAADPEAWARLCQLYGPSVYQRVQKMGLQAEDAADVVQEVFLSVHSGIRNFDHTIHGATFRGWLYRITVNKVRDHYRAASGRHDVAGGYENELNRLEATDGLAFLEDDEDAETFQSEIVHRTLDLLKSEFEESTWRAFLRTAVDGATAAQAAADLGISTGAVYVAKCRVLKRLRMELDGLL